MTKPMTPGQARMARAHAVRRRAAEEVRAGFLRGRGWVVVPPEAIVHHAASDVMAEKGKPPAMWLIYDPTPDTTEPATTAS